MRCPRVDPLRLALALAALALAAACGVSAPAPATPSPPELRLSRIALGTLVELVVRDPNGARGRRAMEAGFAEIERLEGLLSEWRATSEISRLNAGAGREGSSGWVPLSPETAEVLGAALRVAADTGGAFDPTVAPLVDFYGFGPGTPGGNAADLRRLSGTVRYSDLALDPASNRARLLRPRAQVGLGGIGKGFIADRVATQLRVAGVPAAMVKAAGDFACYGGSVERPWPVSIEDPARPGEAIAELALTEGGISTSAPTYRSRQEAGRRVHHIIDPRTGRPAEGAASVTVLARNATTSDAYSTGVFVLGRDGPAFVRERPWLRAVILLDDGTRFVSDDLPVRWIVP